MASSSLDNTRLMPAPAWENPRAHLLDDVWLVTLFAMVLAAGIPWLLSGFEIDLSGATWGLLAIGAIHVAFTMLGNPSAAPDTWRVRALTLLHLAGVALIGFIWRSVGGLQNPAFLLIFALPVVGSVFLSRWHPFLIAVAGWMVACTVALLTNPELRWYAGGLVGGSTALAWLIEPRISGTLPSFSGFYAPANYLLVLLEVFAIFLLALAVTAEYVGTIVGRLGDQVRLAKGAAERGQELWTRLVEKLPLPAVLVDPDTMRIVAASEFALSYLASETLDDQDLLQAIRFSYPDIVQEVIAGSDAEVPVIVLRVADQFKVARLRVLHLAHGGRRLALLTIEDNTETFCVKAVLDTAEYAAVVIDSRNRVLAINKPAAGLFASAQIGMQATRLLPQSVTGLPWWEPGMTGRRKLHLEIGPWLYQVTSCAVTVAGEDERIFTVTFLPVAKAGSNDPFGSATSAALGQLR